MLHDTEGAEFVQPKPLPPEAALEEAEEYSPSESVGEFLETAAFTRGRGFTRKAVHQATETLYQGLLLVLTLYAARAHNLARLRNMTEPLVPRLAEVWPYDTKFQKRCFELSAPPMSNPATRAIASPTRSWRISPNASSSCAKSSARPARRALNDLRAVASD